MGFRGICFFCGMEFVFFLWVFVHARICQRNHRNVKASEARIIANFEPVEALILNLEEDSRIKPEVKKILSLCNSIFLLSISYFFKIMFSMSSSPDSIAVDKMLKFPHCA